MGKMTRATIIRAAVLIASGAALLLIAATSRAGADGPPEVGDRATPDFNGFQPAALLVAAKDDQAIALGSTAGFQADPREPEGFIVSDPLVPAMPGATGWWSIDAPNKTTLTIDSCQSDFKAQLTLGELEKDDMTVNILDASANGCAKPLTADYDGSAGGRLFLRIDDATGNGGDYIVGYARTTTPVRANIKDVDVGARGESPLKAKCSIDDDDAVNCLGGTTFKRVERGEHELTLKVKDDTGEKATDSVDFEVAN